MKRILYYIAVIAIYGLCALLCTEKTKCNLYLDDDGNVCIETADQRKTSPTFYRTEGFTISRCVYNPCAKQLHSGTATEFLEADAAFMMSHTTTWESGGTQYNIFRCKLSDLIGGASPEWRKEVQDALDGTGPAVYIRYDAIMYVYYNNGAIKNPHPFVNHPRVDGTNPSELQGAEGFAGW